MDSRTQVCLGGDQTDEREDAEGASVRRYRRDTKSARNVDLVAGDVPVVHDDERLLVGLQLNRLERVALTLCQVALVLSRHVL